MRHHFASTSTRLRGKKTAPLYLCNNFAETFYSEMIIGTYILQ